MRQRLIIKRFDGSDSRASRRFAANLVLLNLSDLRESPKKVKGRIVFCAKLSNRPRR